MGYDAMCNLHEHLCDMLLAEWRREFFERKSCADGCALGKIRPHAIAAVFPISPIMRIRDDPDGLAAEHLPHALHQGRCTGPIDNRKGETGHPRGPRYKEHG